MSASTHQLIDVEEKQSLSIKLGNPAVLQQLRVFGEETNSENHEKGSVIVSLIGKQKTYKSTHANLLFGTNFPKGMLGMQQTTKGILVESCLISANSKKVNLHCLDYEGFGSTGRDLTSNEEKALDNKLMLLAYSISNLIIFSMHAADLSPFREFAQLMKMCVKGIKTNDQSKKPTLLIFVNVSLGDKNTIIHTALNGGLGKTQDEIREGIHGFATQSLLSQNDFKECRLYFSEVIVQTLYPNQMGNETEGFIIDCLKELVYEKSFSSEIQDSSNLFNEQRWNETVKSINSNEQIEFASDILGRMSENTCSNKCEVLIREFSLKGPSLDCLSELTKLKSNLILEYWKEAKGKFAQKYGDILNTHLEETTSKISPKILLNQINKITKEFKTEMSKLISKDGFSNIKLKNFRSNFIEKWEYEFSMQDFTRLTEKIDNILEELIDDYSLSKMSAAESQVKTLLKKDKINFSELFNLIEETRENLLSFPNVNNLQVVKWYEKYETIISNKKLELDSQKYQSETKNKELVELKLFFLDSLATVTRVDQMDLLLKRCLVNLESKYEGKEAIECEKYLRESFDEYLNNSILPPLINDIEIDFKNTITTITSPKSLKELYDSTIKKYTHPKHSLSIQSINKLKQISDEHLDQSIIPRLINDIEIEFNTSINTITTPHQLNELFKSTLKKYTHYEHALTIESISKMKEKFSQFSNEKGMDLYKSEQFQKAKDWLEYEGQCDATCQLYLGEIYSGKDAGSKNKSIALKYYEQSSNQGNLEATYQLGNLYNGSTKKADILKALGLFEIAANQGHSESQHYLGYYYEFNEQFSKAIRWYTKSAIQDHLDSIYRLGVIYFTVESVKDFQKSRAWLEKGSELGCKDCQCILGALLCHGETGFQDKRKGFEQFEKSAKQGHVGSQSRMAAMYLNGDGVLKDEKKALELAINSANQDCAEGQKLCGLIYVLGLGVEKDLQSARHWLEKSANKGNMRARELLQEHFPTQ